MAAATIHRSPNRAVPLTYEQFRYGFANAVSEQEARQLYEDFAVPASGKSLFQAASANLNPWTEAKVDTKNPGRGPLIISGELDHTAPRAIANASFKQQQARITLLPIRHHQRDGRRPPHRPLECPLTALPNTYRRPAACPIHGTSQYLRQVRSV